VSGNAEGRHAQPGHRASASHEKAALERQEMASASLQVKPASSIKRAAGGPVQFPAFCIQEFEISIPKAENRLCVIRIIRWMYTFPGNHMENVPGTWIRKPKLIRQAAMGGACANNISKQEA